jgi:hypothetical protein
MIETLLGGLLGGLFRCIPEVLKFFDAKNERGHELAMQDKALEFQKLKGDQSVTEIETSGQQTYNSQALEALKAAIASQTVEFKPTGVAWVDMLMAFTVFIVASVRPAVTYIIVGLYVTAKMCLVIQAVQHGQDLDAMVKVMWTADDQGILAALLNFWFLGRVFDKVK